MSPNQPSSEPRPDFLAEAEIDSYRKSAEGSLDWYEELGNPGRLRQLGRLVLNRVGVVTPQQRAMEHHDGIIENYANSIGVEPEAIDGLSEQDHVEARQRTIDEGILSGALVPSERPNTQLTVMGNIAPSMPKQLGVKQYIEGLGAPHEPMPKGVRYLGIRNRSKS